MSTFNLTNTATEVNTALQAVVGADGTPDPASANMVTSQGVYNHIQTQLGPFKGKTVTTESVGIAATDNDTSVPTCAAVNDAITPKIATYEKASGSTSSSVVMPITETSDPFNFSVATAGTVTLVPGTYVVSYTGEFQETNPYTTKYYTVRLRHNGVSVSFSSDNTKIDNTGGYIQASSSKLISSAVSHTVDIYLDETDSTSLQYRNVVLTIIKLA
jgi:hypothetical protein